MVDSRCKMNECLVLAYKHNFHDINIAVHNSIKLFDNDREKASDNIHEIPKANANTIRVCLS